MIESFKCKSTKELWETGISKKIPASLRRAALRKLVLIDDAEEYKDLVMPPGNRLEELKGDRQGQHSIRINDQWRICFKWIDGDAHHVEIIDYH
ncbi:MAG: type II toxin-antitoxin system RelE/ParE family toxin [Alphaproteobacteria bacterium]